MSAYYDDGELLVSRLPGATKRAVWEILKLQEPCMAKVIEEARDTLVTPFNELHPGAMEITIMVSDLKPETVDMIRDAIRKGINNSCDDTAGA